MNIFPTAIATALQGAPWRSVDAAPDACFAHPPLVQCASVVTLGIGIAVTDFSNSYVAYVSNEVLLSQLRGRLPGVDIDAVEALRLVEDCALRAAADATCVARTVAGRDQLTLELRSALEISVPCPSKLHVNLVVECLGVESVVDAAAKAAARTTFLRDAVILPLARRCQLGMAVSDALWDSLRSDRPIDAVVRTVADSLPPDAADVSPRGTTADAIAHHIVASRPAPPLAALAAAVDGSPPGRRMSYVEDASEKERKRCLEEQLRATPSASPAAPPGGVARTDDQAAKAKKIRRVFR
jgi:hypothetical protein